MDLALYARVLWRHRFVLLGGVLLAIILALFSYYRVEMGVPPKLTPRKADVWQSSASVLLTQSSQVIPVPGVSNPQSLADVAGLYARLATSDAVLKRIRGAGRAAGAFEAIPSVDRSGRGVLPVVTLLGTGSTPRKAETILSQGLREFLGYVRTQQEASRIPKKRRVELRILNSPQPAMLVEPRKKTLPIVVFLSVLIAAIASAFILENRIRLSPVAELELRPKPQDEVELRPAAQDEVELRPAAQDEVELRPAPEEVDGKRAAQAGVDVSQKPEDESEPEPAPVVRRWA